MVAKCVPQYLYAAYFAKSPELNRFDSKLDWFLAGRAELTDQEEPGMEIFLGKGRCSGCHAFPAGEERPVFTGFGFANIGVPRNPDNPFYTLIPPLNPAGADFVVLGLCSRLCGLGNFRSVHRRST